MRAHLKINTGISILPFSHQHLLVGTIHKWLGWNDIHGKISLYSFSRLDGGKATKTGLRYDNETAFFFSAYDPLLIKKLVAGIQADNSMFNGLYVSEIILQENPDLKARELFFVASPVLIKRKVDERIEHITYNDPRSNSFLKETLETKMNAAGIIDDSFDVKFEKSYPKAKTQLVSYNGIDNRANWCPVTLKGKLETKLFAWNVGLGNSTGIGFGAIK